MLNQLAFQQKILYLEMLLWPVDGAVFKIVSFLHFVAFSGVASLFVIGVDNRKVGVDNRKRGVDNRKALELINGIISLVQAYFPFGPTFHLGPPLA